MGTTPNRHALPAESTVNRTPSSALNFACQRYSVRGVPVMRLAGDLDLLTAPILRQALQAATDAGFAPVVLDISSLAFMDCTGLRVLDAYVGRGRLHLVRPAREVRRLLELTGYNAAQLHDTVEEAVAAVTQQPDLLSETDRHDSSASAGL